jgi:translation initiation factor 2 subunit 2
MTDLSYEKLFERAKSNIKFVGSAATYTLPELSIIISGKRTIIRNFSQFCSVIRRDPKSVAKFIFKELAIPGILEGGKLILYQKFDKKTVDSVINDYLKNFVLCKECGAKDTVILKHGKTHILRCEACGAERGMK